MNWLRKGFVGLLSIVLLLSLFGIVATANVVHNLQPKKIEVWIAKSKIYDHVIASVLNQSAKDSSTSNDSSVSPSNPEVKQAAESAFSPQLLEQSVNTFLDSNFAWLNGKTAKPDFMIDLSGAKQEFASQVGAAVTKHLSSIPVCTATQLAEIQLPADPLTVTCRPAELNPQTEGARVTEDISNGDFLSKPVLTASNLNQNDQGSQSKPYYEKLSYAPKLYKLSSFAPLILGAVALISAIGVIFLSRDRRRGLRRVGIVTLEVGVILIITKFLADFFADKLRGMVLHGALAGDMKQSVNSFIDQVESQLVLLNLVFGIAFVVAALVLFAVLFKTRDSGAPKPRQAAEPSREAEQPDEPQPEAPLAPRRPQQPRATAPPTNDIADRLKPRAPAKPTGPPALGKNPPRRKPPRLVQ